MPEHLNTDLSQIEQILAQILHNAQEFLDSLPVRPAGTTPPRSLKPLDLPGTGVGALAALNIFRDRHEKWLSGSAGPRYFGFVTGGVTPAALAGDWLASVYDQNAAGSDESAAPQIELEALRLLRQLFDLPETFNGSFVSGATMSNFVGLALARQWLGHQFGADAAEVGLQSLPIIRVYSGTPHSSIFKALSMLGIGRQALKRVACLPDREAVDLAALEMALQGQNGQPCIVVANAGTVNTVDFDDLAGIARLKESYPFWLHVDAAFGGFAACSPKTRSLLSHVETADSLTIDAHKWLNVPYDSAMQFSPHLMLQAEIFQNAAVYLGSQIHNSSFVHLTPENSRRLRALPAWLTLMAYGAQGYAEIVERDCALAHWLGEKIKSSAHFRLLAPVRLNGVCFTLDRPEGPATIEQVQAYLSRLTSSGEAFMTPTVYQGIAAIRVSVSNWRTSQADMALTWQAMLDNLT